MKTDLSYIDHIIDCIEKVNRYTQKLDKNEFAANELIQDAVIRNLEIIGEAAKKISKSFKNKHQQIPWREITGIRDKLIHDYLGVDIDVVYNTIKKDLPGLKDYLDKIEK
jgi:uncharacterized protein with HEPN domain